MKTTKQILSLAAAAMMLSAASAQGQGGVNVQGAGKAPVAVAEMPKPLYIVDGRAVELDEIKNLDPSQIESMSVFKDKSAEQYASLGDVSNGVIVITLRSDDDKFYVTVDEMPTFLGGDINTFRNWVQQQVRYPADAMKRNIQGDVVVKFIVGKDGLIESSNLEVLSSPDAMLTDEVMRVLRQSPAWSAGRHDGKNVRVSLALPISFRLMNISADVEKNGNAAASDNHKAVDEIVVVGFGSDK